MSAQMDAWLARVRLGWFQCPLPTALPQVRSTPLAAIRAGRPQAWRPLFESEVLSFPGFVEFDDVSNVVTTFSAVSG